ncbi:FeoA family protein [Phosphitispora sp. TUW77]|uniref:FeoA family protein n=1 Tax=Phosphitispora sp. TUW77 TaxID=3152361 RepID=UPI003AB8A9C3
MKRELIPLNRLPLGRAAKVWCLTNDGNTRRRMMDIGLIKDTQIEAIQKSPSGDPTAYFIRGAVIALRSDEASRIIVEALTGE